MIVPGTTFGITLEQKTIRIKDKGRLIKTIKVKGKSFEQVRKELEKFFYYKGKILPPALVEEVMLKIGIPKAKKIFAEVEEIKVETETDDIWGTVEQIKPESKKVEHKIEEPKIKESETTIQIDRSKIVRDIIDEVIPTSTPKVETPVETPKVETPVETPKVETPVETPVEAPKVEAPIETPVETQPERITKVPESKVDTKPKIPTATKSHERKIILPQIEKTDEKVLEEILEQTIRQSTSEEEDLVSYTLRIIDQMTTIYDKTETPNKVDTSTGIPKKGETIEAPKVEASQVKTPKVEAPIETPKVAPQVETPVETPKVEAPKVEAPIETPKVAPQVETPVETPNVESQASVEIPTTVPIEAPEIQKEEMPVEATIESKEPIKEEVSSFIVRELPKYKVKIVVLGEDDVGMSALFENMNFEEIEEQITALSTMNVFRKEISLKDVVFDIEIWPLSRAKKIKITRGKFYADAEAAIIVYSVVDRWSFQSIDYWVKEINQMLGPNVPLLIVGNKIDLRIITANDQDMGESPVTKEEAIEKIKLISKAREAENGQAALFVETSIVTGPSIEEGLKELLKIVKERKSK